MLGWLVVACAQWHVLVMHGITGEHVAFADSKSSLNKPAYGSALANTFLRTRAAYIALRVMSFIPATGYCGEHAVPLHDGRQPGP
jgi:hypothetical protein